MAGISYGLTEGLGAALNRAGVALGGATVTGFERVGRSGGDCSEGSDGKKGSDAHVHDVSGRVAEWICWRGDGIVLFR